MGELTHEPRHEMQDVFMNPCTDLFWTNRRGHRLHVRCAEHPEPEALFVFTHGYGCHMNSPKAWNKLCKYGERMRVHVICFDMEGHGYSEGERGLVKSMDDLATDLADFVELLYSGEAHGESFKLSQSFLEKLPQLPYVLSGESLGAAVSLLAAGRLQPLGLILAAPIIQDDGPWHRQMLGGALRRFLKVADTFDSVGLPKSLLPDISGDKLFCDPEDIEHFDRDHGGADPESLGFTKQNMKAQTAGAILEMFHYMPERLRALETPFIVFHDPEDRVNAFKNSEYLMETAAAAEKTLVRVPKGRHVPHYNQDSMVLPHCEDFLLKQLQSWKVEASTSHKAVRTSRLGPAAMDRWGAPKHVAPQVTLAMLLCEAAVVLSPFLLFIDQGAFGVVVGIQVLLLLVGGHVLLTALLSAWEIRSAMKRTCGTPSNESVVPSDSEVQVRHLICVPIYKEPDEMILATISRLNASPSAGRMRVIFAMEEATDRVEERVKLYSQCLDKVSEVCYYIHPAGATRGEIKGLCSNLAYALSQEQRQLANVGKYVFTKVDSQVLLPKNYFQQLEASFLSRNLNGMQPVVWQPQLVSFLNRELTHGPLRSLGALRTFCYPTFFDLSLCTITCYSVPLEQYIQMGLHHPSYMGEDCMVLAQSAVTAGHCNVKLLPVLVSVAAPLDSSFLGALKEGARQCDRWAAQSQEVLEFRWRFRKPGTTLRSLFWIFKYWLLRMVLANGLGVLALSLSLTSLMVELPKEKALILFVFDKVLQATVLSLVILMPLYEQYLAWLLHDSDAQAPLWQLPITIASTPAWLFFQMLVDFVAWTRLLVLGKGAITLTHRKKMPPKSPAAVAKPPIDEKEEDLWSV